MKLTIFYDGTCPLCSAEMSMLRQYDHHNRLRLEDIHANDFSGRYPMIDVVEADRILHGLDDQGQLLYGLDVTVMAWRLVERKRWLQVLRWPLIRWVADKAYLWFARHRTRISSLLMGSSVCRTDRASASRRNCARSVNEDQEF